MKKLIGAVLCVSLLGIVLLVIRCLEPKRVAANVLIEKTGRYRSPNGKMHLDIWEENEGELKFFVYRQKNGGRSGGGPTNPFQAESDWFMCWDYNDRLWSYVPEQDHQYCRNWYANAEASGTGGSGELGGWEGIPSSFFTRLPDIVKETYRRYISTLAPGKSEQDAESDGEDAAGQP